MSTLMIREHMPSYATAASQLVDILETSRRALAPADRRAIQKTLDAMIDLNVMLLFRLSRRRISADQIADMRKMIADLADLSPGQGSHPPAKREGDPERIAGVECHASQHPRQIEMMESKANRVRRAVRTSR